MSDKLTDVTDNNVGKMTDKEIKKALSCCMCNTDGLNCLDCPLLEVDDCQAYIFNLIDRLEAENETLRTCVANNFVIRKDGKSPLALLKAEAYKEFAEKMNKEAEEVGIDREGDFVETHNKIYDTVADWCKATSDNLLKEMVGEDK